MVQQFTAYIDGFKMKLLYATSLSSHVTNHMLSDHVIDLPWGKKYEISREEFLPHCLHYVPYLDLKEQKCWKVLKLKLLSWFKFEHVTK